MRSYSERMRRGPQPVRFDQPAQQIIAEPKPLPLPVVEPKPRSVTGMPPPDASEVPAEDGTTWIRVDRTRPMSRQPRTRIDPTDMAVFTAGMVAEGQNDPVKVKRVTGDSDHDYELIGGERRWRAAKTLGISHLKAIFRQPKDFTEQFRWAAIDNIGRAEIHALDVADTIKTFQGFPEFAEMSLTAQLRALSVVFCHPVSWVARRHDLNELDPQVRAMLEPTVPVAQRLSVGVGSFLSKIRDRKEQVHMAMQAVTNSWSVKQAKEYYAQRVNAAPVQRGFRSKDPRPASGFRVTASDWQVFRGFVHSVALDLALFGDKLEALLFVFHTQPRKEREELLRLMKENSEGFTELKKALERKE